MKLYIKIYIEKKLFDVLYEFSLRKHSAKAVSSGFFFQPLFVDESCKYKNNVYIFIYLFHV